MPGVWILWSKKKNSVIIFQKENGNTFTLLIIFVVKSLQKEQNNTNLLLCPPSAGTNLQSPQSDSTPWTLTLVSVHQISISILGPCINCIARFLPVTHCMLTAQWVQNLSEPAVCGFFLFYIFTKNDNFFMQENHLELIMIYLHYYLCYRCLCLNLLFSFTSSDRIFSTKFQDFQDFNASS